MRALWEIIWFPFHIIEWFCLYYIEPQEKGQSGALGNPTIQWRYDRLAYWVRVREVVDYKYSGKYKLTDKMGKGLNWLDVKDGMMVKIKAKQVNYPGNDYFQPVPNGNQLSELVINIVQTFYLNLLFIQLLIALFTFWIGYVWFYDFGNDNGEKNWKIHFVNDYSTVAFENPTHDNYYLGVGSNKWLEMKSKSQLKWRRTNCPEIWTDW